MMTFKRFVKAFVAGMAFPAVFLPIAYTILCSSTNSVVTTVPVQFVPMIIPMIFGITNVIYNHVCEGVTGKKANKCLWLTGGALGLVVATVGVFFIQIPQMIFSTILQDNLTYLPLIVLPIVYGAIFRYIVKWMNKLLAV